MSGVDYLFKVVTPSPDHFEPVAGLSEARRCGSLSLEAVQLGRIDQRGERSSRRVLGDLASR